MSVSGSTRVARADPSCIEKLEAVIDQMPANPEPQDERLTMRQLVHRLYQKILHLKALGYGIRFICKLLQTHSGLPFKEHTLATYLSLEKLGGRHSSSSTRQRRSSKRGHPSSSSRLRPIRTAAAVEPSAAEQPHDSEALSLESNPQSSPSAELKSQGESMNGSDGKVTLAPKGKGQPNYSAEEDAVETLLVEPNHKQEASTTEETHARNVQPDVDVDSGVESGVESDVVAPDVGVHPEPASDTTLSSGAAVEGGETNGDDADETELNEREDAEEIDEAADDGDDGDDAAAPSKPAASSATDRFYQALEKGKTQFHRNRNPHARRNPSS